jgi:hypothetical protein
MGKAVPRAGDDQRIYLQIELKILPLKESCVTRAFHEALEWITPQMIENLFDVRLKEVGWNFVLLQETVDVKHALFGVFLSESESDK